METYQIIHKDGRVFTIIAINLERAKDIFYIV